VFALVFLGGDGSRPWAYAAAGLIVVLELAQIQIVR
jgi:hypothetical protein